MVDLRQTIAPKSDQLNADDLIGMTRTIKVTGVKLCGAPDQPIALNFAGDNGKPYKPCKSMRRVLVNVWGPDGNAYAGRSMTLYRDDKVQFGGLEVGGIRISHMSHINAPVTMALTATKAKRKPYTVQPLAGGGGPSGHRRTLSEALDDLAAMLTAEKAPTRAAVDDVMAGEFFGKIKGAATKEPHASRFNQLVKAALDRTEEPAAPGEGDGLFPGGLPSTQSAELADALAQVAQASPALLLAMKNNTNAEWRQTYNALAIPEQDAVDDAIAARLAEERMGV